MVLLNYFLKHIIMMTGLKMKNRLIPPMRPLEGGDEEVK